MGHLSGSMRRPVRADGFTLVEILVVMVLIALCAGVAVIAAAPDERALLASEGERLAASFELADLEARLTGDTIYWGAEGTRYTFRRVRRDGAAAAADTASALAREHRLPHGIAIGRLGVEGRRVEPPALTFAPHRGAAPFTLELVGSDGRSTITRSAMGELRFVAAK